jgi:hypothetical protein
MVTLNEIALSDKNETVPLSGNNGNWGGVYVGEHMKVADVTAVALETAVPWRVNFIKIDVEGYELKVLRGAGNLINRCKPTMVIEINPEALQRQGDKPDDIYTWLEEHSYRASIMQENCGLSSPLYDILCIPKTQPSETTQDEVPPSPAPVAAPLTPYGEMIAAVQLIKQFASQSTNNRQSEMAHLRHAGLIRRTNKKCSLNGCSESEKPAPRPLSYEPPPSTVGEVDPKWYKAKAKKKPQ